VGAPVLCVRVANVFFFSVALHATVNVLQT
jgi:hypothetical protein